MWGVRRSLTLQVVLLIELGYRVTSNPTESRGNCQVENIAVQEQFDIGKVIKMGEPIDMRSSF